MKKLLIVVIFLVTSSAFAESKYCKTIEYAELKDMPIKELQDKIDLYNRFRDILMESARTTSAYISALKDFEEAGECSSEIERMKRVLNSKNLEKQLPSVTPNWMIPNWK